LFPFDITSSLPPAGEGCEHRREFCYLHGLGDVRVEAGGASSEAGGGATAFSRARASDS
jgi:hypothetical protein